MIGERTTAVLLGEPKEECLIRDVRRSGPIQFGGINFKSLGDGAEKALSIDGVRISERTVNIKYGKSGHRWLLWYNGKKTATGYYQVSLSDRDDTNAEAFCEIARRAEVAARSQ